MKEFRGNLKEFMAEDENVPAFFVPFLVRATLQKEKGLGTGQVKNSFQMSMVHQEILWRT